MTVERADPVDDAEVSVVVQGPATKTLPGVVASVRRYLPNAELIVSTWQGADVAGLDADEIILNVDPGSVPYLDALGHPSPKPFNTNRMLVSTRAGLLRASRPWAIKLRNDTPLRSAGCLAWFGRHNDRRVASYRVFEQRVATVNVAVRPGLAMPGFLFHPSDIVHLGQRADLVRLWDAQPIDEDENATWFKRRARPNPDVLPGSWCRYYNEQVVWLSCLRRHGYDVGYDYAGHYSRDLVRVSEASIVNNFVVAEPWQLGISLSFGDLTRLFPIWQYAWHPSWKRMTELLSPS
jgi:WavE lipopolysaccharide synthesis